MLIEVPLLAVDEFFDPVAVVVEDVVTGPAGGQQGAVFREQRGGLGVLRLFARVFPLLPGDVGSFHVPFLRSSLVVCIEPVPINMVDDAPHIFISCGTDREYGPVLPGNIADAAADRAAINRDLPAIRILKNDIRTHSQVRDTLVIREAYQHIGILQQVTGVVEDGVCHAAFICKIGLRIRMSKDIDPNEAIIHIACEVGGYEHGRRVIDALEENGYDITIE